MRQVQHDTTSRALDPYAEFQQPLAKGTHLGASTVARAGAKTQLLHQHVSGGRQQNAELIGLEIRAAGAVDFQTVVQLLFAILNVSTVAVDLLVDPSDA
jgi:hypothetical protein